MGTATPTHYTRDGRRVYKPGDRALFLNVDGLNGFAAMMATMKEMGTRFWPEATLGMLSHCFQSFSLTLASALLSARL